MRAYRNAWARAHYKRETKKCEQLLCTRRIPKKRHYCDEDQQANRQWKWTAQNNRRRAKAA